MLTITADFSSELLFSNSDHDVTWTKLKRKTMIVTFMQCCKILLSLRLTSRLFDNFHWRGDAMLCQRRTLRTVILARAYASDVAYMHDCASTIEEQTETTGMRNEFEKDFRKSALRIPRNPRSARTNKYTGEHLAVFKSHPANSRQRISIYS